MRSGRISNVDMMRRRKFVVGAICLIRGDGKEGREQNSLRLSLG